MFKIIVVLISLLCLIASSSLKSVGVNMLTQITQTDNLGFHGYIGPCITSSQISTFKQAVSNASQNYGSNLKLNV